MQQGRVTNGVLFIHNQVNNHIRIHAVNHAANIKHATAAWKLTTARLRRSTDACARSTVQSQRSGLVPSNRNHTARQAARNENKHTQVKRSRLGSDAARAAPPVRSALRWHDRRRCCSCCPGLLLLLQLLCGSLHFCEGLGVFLAKRRRRKRFDLARTSRASSNTENATRISAWHQRARASGARRGTKETVGDETGQR